MKYNILPKEEMGKKCFPDIICLLILSSLRAFED